MRAVVCREWCEYDDLELAEVPPPAMRPGGVRIRVRYSGVSFATTLVVAGRYQRKPPRPFAPGTEVAGEVMECAPDVTHVRPGDRVFAIVDWGGYAEEVVAREVNVFGLPDGLPLQAAPALAASYPTSYGALLWRAGLKEGDRLLVHGAAGGVGLAAVEIGRNVGARVYATAGAAEKRAAAAARGAGHVFDSRVGDFRERVLDATGGEGVDVVYDPVGGDAFSESLRCLREGGRIVSVGYTSGAIPTVPVNRVMLRNVSAMGFNWGQYVGWSLRDEREHWAGRVKGAMDQLVAWWQEGKIDPHIHAAFDLAEFRAAMAEVTGRRAIGRVVVTP